MRAGRDRLLGAVLGAAVGLLARDLTTDSFASVWVPAALLGALLFATRLKALLLAASAALALSWLVVAFTPLAAWMVRGLVRRDTMAPADAVLVLGSRLQRDGEPTAAALSRLLRGFELLREGTTARLVVTESAGTGGSHVELVQRLAAPLGLSPEVLAVGPVRRTRDEAVLVGALCRRQGWRRLLVVTSPTHSRRACAAVEREGVVAVCRPALETEFDVERLDRPGERLAAFRAALHEWLGWWLYRRRGWA